MAAGCACSATRASGSTNTGRCPSPSHGRGCPTGRERVCQTRKIPSFPKSARSTLARPICCATVGARPCFPTALPAATRPCASNPCANSYSCCAAAGYRGACPIATAVTARQPRGWRRAGDVSPRVINSLRLMHKGSIGPMDDLPATHSNAELRTRPRATGEAKCHYRCDSAACGSLYSSMLGGAGCTSSVSTCRKVIWRR